MKPAQIAVDEVSKWLLNELICAPELIKTIYVECNHSYLAPNTLQEVVFASMATFGFAELDKETFDCSNPDHLSELGDFEWEGPKFLNLKVAEYSDLDWTEVLKKAAVTPSIKAIVRDRDLLLLVGYHDDAVYDVS